MGSTGLLSNFHFSVLHPDDVQGLAPDRSRCWEIVSSVSTRLSSGDRSQRGCMGDVGHVDQVESLVPSRVVLSSGPW